jgi:hypothetical protein
MGGSIYGAGGIIVAQVFYCFPHALMILVAALSMADARLYEAPTCSALPRRASSSPVTLPGAKYGVISAGFVIFTLVVTDFGIAKVIGGRFNVLATDIFKQVIGQQNFEMGAVVGFVLLIPAVVAFRRQPHHRRRRWPCCRRAPCRSSPSARPAATGYCSPSARSSAADPGAPGDGGLGLAGHPLALQPDADAEELRLQRIRLQRLERVLESLELGRLDGGDRHGRRLPGAYLLEKTRGFAWGAASRSSWPCCRWPCPASCSAWPTSSSSTPAAIRWAASTRRWRSS